MHTCWYTIYIHHSIRWSYRSIDTYRLCRLTVYFRSIAVYVRTMGHSGLNESLTINPATSTENLVTKVMSPRRFQRNSAWYPYLVRGSATISICLVRTFLSIPTNYHSIYLIFSWLLWYPKHDRIISFKTILHLISSFNRRTDTHLSDSTVIPRTETLARKPMLFQSFNSTSIWVRLGTDFNHHVESPPSTIAAPLCHHNWTSAYRRLNHPFSRSMFCRSTDKHESTIPCRSSTPHHIKTSYHRC